MRVGCELSDVHRQAEANRKSAWVSLWSRVIAMDALEPAAMQTRDMRDDGQPQTAVSLLTAG